MKVSYCKNDVPEVAGELYFNAPLDKFSFFGVGGKADILFVPKDMDDLTFFLREKEKDIPVTVIGACSNLLIRDGGVRGIVIKLCASFENIFINDNIVEVGAACALTKLSNKVADNGLSGFEFLSTIPGSVGGALISNAGCYGASIADIFIEAEAIDLSGTCKWLTKNNIDFSYRNTSIRDVVITRCWLKGVRSDTATVSKKMHEFILKRKMSQAVMYRSCGSFFKNPLNSEEKAWQLIDRAGCRGLKVGGAMVSDVHCNFIVNTGKATASEIEELGEEVARRVKNSTGVSLDWEVVRIGEKI